MTPKIATLASLLCMGTNMLAQESVMGRNLWIDQQTNEQQNIRFHSANPTRQAFNVQRNTAYAQADYTLLRGSFHAADQSGKRNDMNFYFGGLKQLGRIDLAGSLRYENIQARHHAWNSTYGLEPENPFIIGDSVRGRTTVEAFYLNATAAYSFSDTWRAALQVDLQNASSSDQNDPRPKVNTTILPVTAGAEWQATDAFAMGGNLGARIFNSDMAYTVVNNRITHPYFLMKGMGDQRNMSTGSEAGYKRDYHGFAYNAALQAVWQQEGSAWADFLQISAERGYEDAKDGGSSYTYRGGDYDFTRLHLTDRLQFRPSDRMLHQFFLDATYQKGEGTWYDQQRFTDTEHNNRTDYEILGKKKLHNIKKMSFDVSYQIDSNQKEKGNIHANINIGFENNGTTHYLKCSEQDQRTGRTNTWYENLKQEWTLIHCWADARHEFSLRRGLLNVTLGGGHWMPIGDKKFATASEPGASGTLITRDYVAPQFEYLSASHYRTSALADYSLPLRQETLTLGIFARVDYARYSDDAEYSDRFKSTSLTTTQVGLYLHF